MPAKAAGTEHCTLLNWKRELEKRTGKENWKRELEKRTGKENWKRVKSRATAGLFVTLRP
jgi:hypothetical protein